MAGSAPLLCGIWINKPTLIIGLAIALGASALLSPMLQTPFLFNPTINAVAFLFLRRDRDSVRLFPRPRRRPPEPHRRTAP